VGREGIAFLATGSELVSGSVINTSTPWMADHLFELGFETTEHRVVSDSQRVIAEAMRELIERYAIVIITGGLGPTSDDRTRFALAEVLGIELEFQESVWESIRQRFRVLNLPIPENNRSQAMLPPGATVLENKQGSAAGCYVLKEDCHIFMLPGPPNECQPMFKRSVLPGIKAKMESNWPQKKHWFLLGVSEGSIAALCDPLVDNDKGAASCPRLEKTNAVQLAYRVEYPYLELKLLAKTQKCLDHIAFQIENRVEKFAVGNDRASKQLVEKLAYCKDRYSLNDRATGQRLISRLLFPHTQQVFSDDAVTVIEVRGLADFWAGEKPVSHRIELTIKKAGEVLLDESREIPHRGLLSLELASEWICWEWLKHLSK
jgi:molybdenum cofactor synthesis domain-containing protein